MNIIRKDLAVVLFTIPLLLALTINSCNKREPKEVGEFQEQISKAEVEKIETEERKDIVLSLKDVNWTESVGARGTPPIYSDITGMAGVGATGEEAKANLSPIQMGKDSSGRSIIYIEQKRPFRGLKVFYLKIKSGSIYLDEETIKKLKGPQIELTQVSDAKLEIEAIEIQCLKIVVKLVAPMDMALEFTPSQIYTEMQDGSKIREWSFLSFFPKAEATLNKGDAVRGMGREMDGTVVEVRKFDLKPGSTAKITVPLKSGIPQKAVLIFMNATKAKASKLWFANLPPVRI